jgi:alpha-beta hydrolase superfamily lysophospholipase|tara:strand:+ start:1157 stop:2053 length:897 start_codon:yes stop_codon:yes gene_type:complete
MHFSKKNKDYIYSNLSCNENVKGIVHICHGKGEHIGRYSWVINKLNLDGYHVISMDHRGHGKWIQNNHVRGVFSENNGWEVITEDLRELIVDTKNNYPHLDQYLLAHSMGSWVGLNLIMQDINIKGLIISGSSKFPKVLLLAQKFLINISIVFNGKYSINSILNYLTDKTWNKKFKPNRTLFDWISSDPDNVDDYVNDELCGFSVSNLMWQDIANGCLKAFDSNNYINSDKNLPILLIAGTKDPVSNFGKGMDLLNEMLSKIFMNVSYIKVENDRHEVFSGLNKEFAYNKMKSFLDNF